MILGSTPQNANIKFGEHCEGGNILEIYVLVEDIENRESNLLEQGQI